ncbi:MAG: hypothetical protein RL385_2302 [Pseudomonadota bacterium]
MHHRPVKHRSDSLRRPNAAVRAGSIVLMPLFCACTSGEPAGPAPYASAAVTPRAIEPGRQPTAEVYPDIIAGPAPLRRLSNREYVYSLADLFPGIAPEVPTLPDDADVGGFDNAAEGQAPSDVRIARYEAIAKRYAQAATKDTAAVQALVGCEFATPGPHDACALSFIESMGRRVFRRGVSAAERERLFQTFQRAALAVDFEAAVQLVLEVLLQSPQFLYRVEDEPSHGEVGVVKLNDSDMASRLSYFLWGSTPDDTLLDAAAEGRLGTEAGISAEVDRMLADPRLNRAMWDFHRQWLGIDRILGEEHRERATSVDPNWSVSLPQAAYDETRRFIEHTMGEDGRVTELLLSRAAWLDGTSASLYGLQGFSGSVPVRTDLPVERGGVLTRAAFLAGFSHRGTTSPPVRANAVQLRLLCRAPTPPPPGVSTTIDDAADTTAPRTTRMLFDQKTKPAACQGCHVNLNGLGFGFESFDASGRYRVLENGLPVDSSGHFWLDDVDTSFKGAVQLSERLAQSHELAHCAALSWLRFALGRAPVAEEYPFVDVLAAQFFDGGSDVRDLLRGIAKAPSFRYRQVGGAP